MRMLALLVAVPLVTGSLRADEKVDTSKLREQAEVVGKAVLDGDYGKVVDLSHPKIVEVMGGKAKMVEETAKIMKAMKDQGFTFEKYTVGKPGDPVIDGKTAYVVVPTTLLMGGPKLKIEAESYLLSVTTDGGKTWTFADGAGMDNPQLRDKVFPKLPDGLKLPEKKQPKITKE